tara:strand:- start:1114 stop:1608 length:495 start_codon:yes stop_codon:yes gene_type:complete
MTFYFIWNYYTSLLLGGEMTYPYLLPTLGSAAAVSISVWFFSKTTTYLVAWYMLFFTFLFTFTDPNNPANQDFGGLMALALVVVPIIIIYLARKIITKAVVGFVSGLYMSIGLLIVILSEKIKSGTIFTERPTYILYVLGAFLIGGIIFQFSPFANKKVITEEE